MIHADPISIQLALRECIKLEKRGYTYLGSLQVAYGEYAQFLTTLGDYQSALHFSDLAIEEADKAVQSGYAWAEQERAVLLVERRTGNGKMISRSSCFFTKE